MSMLNSHDNNWRLCKGIKVNENVCSFTLRTYKENAEIDDKKYSSYFNGTLKPLIQRSNFLIEKYNKLFK